MVAKAPVIAESFTMRVMPQTRTALAVGARDFKISHVYTNGQAAAREHSIQVIVTDQAFANEVVGTTGTFDSSTFRNPQAVLGQPTRFTSPSA